MNTLAVEQKDKWRAFAGTLLFHALILLAFFLIVFTNPDPPLFSDNAGVEVNFGYMDEGMGEIQPEPDKQLVTTAPQKEQQQQTKQEEKEIITQEIEDAPEIMKKETLKKEVKKNVVVIEKPKKDVPKQPVVDESALYKPKKKGGEGETGKPGDQGIEEGSLLSKTHGKNMGSGDHGDGTGKDGNGGNGDGKGISFNLGDRSMRIPPHLSDQSQEQGKVVIDITVDKEGNVLSANGPGRGSTTTSSNLLKKAKEAALRTKFSKSPQGVEEQRGTITFVFILR